MATVGRTSMAITGSVTSGTKQSGGSPELPTEKMVFICYKMMGQQIKLIRALVPSLPPGKAAASLWDLEPLQLKLSVHHFQIPS